MELSATQIWISIGAAMLIAELLSTSLFFVFLSIAGFATAILTFLGITDSPASQALAFSAISVISLVALRKPLKTLLHRNSKSIEYTEYLGDKATVIEPIKAGQEGKVFFRGTEWTAIAENNEAIDSATTVVIKKLDGIRLIVGKE